jgi:general secretion pathway protein I
MPSPARGQGFTLIEVLVATAIIAVTLGAIIRATGLGAANETYLRDKTFAHWVAMNRMAEIESSRTYPPLGRKTGKEEMADREWYWTTEVKNTPDEDMRRVEIRIRQERRRSAPTITELVGFVTRFGRSKGTPK